MTIQSISYGAVQTAYVSYTSYDLDVANSISTFVWPTPYATSPNVLAATTNFVVTKTGCKVNFPNANEVSLGMNIFIRNDGSSSEEVTINDNLGNPIEVIDPGEVWWIQLTAYTNDSAGVWIPIQQGAGTSQATAADLAGKGLEAVATRLNTVIPPKTITANYTIVDADQSGLILINSTGLVTITLGEYRGGFSVSFNNIGTGDVFFTGIVNNSTAFSLGSSQTVTLINDAIDTNKWWTLGLGQGTSFLDSVVSVDLTDIASTGGTLVLSASQLNAFIQQFYSDDPITQDIVIYYGNNSGNWYVANFCSTTNGSTISLSLGLPVTPAGTPIVVPMGAKLIYYAANDPTTNQLSLFTIPSILSLQKLLLADGTAAAPSLSFSSDQTSGFYLENAFQPSISANAVQVATFDGTTDINPKILANSGTSDYPVYTFDTGTDFGMGLVNPGKLGFFGGNAAVCNTLVTSGGVTNSTFIEPTSGNTLALTIDNAKAVLDFTIGGSTGSISTSATNLTLSYFDGTTTGKLNLSVPSATSTALTLSSPAANNLLITVNDATPATVSYGGNLAVSIANTGAMTFAQTANFTQRNATLNALLPNPAALGNMLAYDGANWILTPAAAAGSILYFNGANWVSIPAPTAGGYLYYSGGVWKSTAAPNVGEITYFDGTDWINLAPGADGSVLTLAGGLPTWAP
jgi:hypothetical protein